jgi:hypothetical protein
MVYLLYLDYRSMTLVIDTNRHGMNRTKGYKGDLTG